MMDRLYRDLVTVACWLLPSFFLTLCYLHLQGGTRGGSVSETLEPGGQKKQLVKPIQVSQLNSIHHDDSSSVANMSNSQLANFKHAPLASNAVEAQIKPLEQLQVTELDTLAKRYEAVLDEKHVGIEFKLDKRVPLDAIGSVYAFELSKGNFALYDKRGRRDEVPSGYQTNIARGSVPEAVFMQAQSDSGYLNHFSPDVKLILDQRVSIEMHRSLYAFIAKKGLRDLLPDSLYIATIRAGESLDFQWACRPR